MDETQIHESGDILARPTNRLLDDFGAGKASPGSGSAAALMGLLAVKLIRTVCKKSLEKEACAAAKPTLIYVLEQVEALEPTLVSLFEKDAREFDEIVEIRKRRDRAQSADERAKLSRRAQ